MDYRAKYEKFALDDCQKAIETAQKWVRGLRGDLLSEACIEQS
jgi:hypothetical protein